MGKARTRVGRPAMIVVGVFTAAGLIAAIFWRIPFDLNDFRGVLSGLPGIAVAGVVLSTGFHCLVTGRKWQLVTRHSAHGVDLGPGFYFYSTLIALFGHIMPLQVAVLSGRSLTLRFHGAVPVRRGAAGAVYDQLFDVMVPTLALASALPYLFGLVTLPAAALGTIATLLIAGWIIAWQGERTLVLLARAVTWIAPRMRDRIAVADRGLFSRRLLGTLYAYSIVRYVNLVFRAWLIAWAMGIDVHWAAIMYSNSVVTFSLLVSFVPGALGVMEWGWIGSLQLFGLPGSTAAQYALASRILIVVSLLMLNAGNALLFAAYRVYRAKHQGR